MRDPWIWVGMGGWLAVWFGCSMQAWGQDGSRETIPEQVKRIPELGIEIPAEREASLRLQLAELQEKIAGLRAAKKTRVDGLLPDVMIFERAVRMALDYREFFEVKELDKAESLLAEGIRRADQLQAGTADWTEQTGLVVRGYISELDQTVQPYGLVIPNGMKVTERRPMRCDVWFHGRGEKLSEVNFLSERMHWVGEFSPADTVVLHPYGRYCNAFKFAGEVDVWEALADVQRRYAIDPDRISVRGFSMGGAACWQFATHYADRWFAANPGAGFSESPLFLKIFQTPGIRPTPWEQKLWSLYDCDKWALNLTQCPTIAYSGEKDGQKQAAEVMERALAPYGIQLRHVIGKGMGHQFDRPSKEVIEGVMQQLAKRGKPAMRSELRFTTATLKYDRMDWLRVHGLEEHFVPGRVDVGLDWGEGGKRLTVHFKTLERVTDVSIDLPAGTASVPMEQISVVGVEGLTSEPKSVHGLYVYSDGSIRFRIRKGREGGWDWVGIDAPTEGKRHGVQGPIDDALMGPFVFVRPTGKVTHERVGKWVESELERGIEHWRRHFRGDVRVVADHEVTDDLVRNANLILWGEPGSNAWIAKVLGEVPIGWNERSIQVGEKQYDASHHVPIMIYPNPKNPARYVVWNSSFTFRENAYLNNARQVPMLPDWAVVDIDTPVNAVWPGKVVEANFFDEAWKLK